VSPKKSLVSISFVMPVLNEEAHLRTAVSSIFEQKGLDHGQIEVILAIGPSTDGTKAIAESLKAQYPVTIVSNPTGKTPAGLNLAIKAAKNEVIVRVDAHSQLSPDYTQIALEVLNTSGAANVGGVMKAVGATPFQQAVAFAYGSRFGLGGGAYHVGGSAGPSDSVYLGVFRREVLEKLGGFNEKMIRGQDWELNLRIRESGQQVWFDPRLEVTYYPRSSLSKLAKQFFDTGAWRAHLTKAHLNKVNVRYFAPPLLVLGTLAGLVGYLTGILGTFGLLPLIAYLVGVGLLSLGSNSLNMKAKLALLVALPAMHFSWGSGFIAGLFNKSGN
jgi:glycosyltransferase involved in cell wall biosynthesis